MAPRTPAPSPAPTLRALLARRELQLRLESDEGTLAPGALDEPLRWVHSSDLADPTPFLSEGLLLLTTGTQFIDEPDDSPAFDGYVRRLAQRGVAGLGFGTEVVRDGIPDLLAAACREQRMPLFEVPYRTPFIAVARANAEAIAAEAYARRSWALAAQRAISLAALRPDGLGATLAELARQLDGWVGLYDATGSLAREYPAAPFDDATRALLDEEVSMVLRRGIRAGSSLRTGVQAFSLQTLGRGGALRGVIAIAAGDLDQESRGVVTSVIALAGLALEQQRDLARARGLLRAGLLQSLLADDNTLGLRIARDMWGGLPSAPIVVAVTDEPGGRREAIAEYLELRSSERRAHLFFAHEEGGFTICGEAGSTDAVLSLAGALHDAFGVRVGLSEPAGYAEFSRAHEQARSALQRAHERDAALVTFADIAREGVLSLVDAAEAGAVARSVLAPLLRHDDVHDTELVRTLRTWLEADAVIDAAARRLGVHRHTVRARIALSERLLDRDLSGFAARADLWAALRALG